MSGLSRGLTARLKEIVGARYVLTDPYEVRLYGYDAGLDEQAPAAVLVPGSRAELEQIFDLLIEAEHPIVARGGGTGLSGGATPLKAAVALALNRLNRVLEVDPDHLWARVEPGVINLRLSEHTRRWNLCFAPDPSSQKASTLGGNIAENAGGPHTLRYGVTGQHVLGLTMLLPRLGPVPLVLPQMRPGLDLLGLMVGSEGTFGVVSEAKVRLSPLPESVATVVAPFAQMAQAAAAVSAIMASGLVPAALEMIDRMCIRAVESHLHPGYPTDADAVLLVEVEGLREEVVDALAKVRALLTDHGALQLREASDAQERAMLWRGRKEAAGALGRLARFYYVMDGVVPVSRIPQVLAQIASLGKSHGLPVGNVFHAGDGNLHPNVLFNQRQEIPRVLALADAIERLCLEAGGSLSGEHGIGIEKLHLMTQAFTADTLEAMERVKMLFDPDDLLNPGKVLPRSGKSIERPLTRLPAGGWI